MTSSLEKCPVEILGKVFSHLHYTDILSLSCVSKSIKYSLPEGELNKLEIAFPSIAGEGCSFYLTPDPEQDYCSQLKLLLNDITNDGRRPVHSLTLMPFNKLDCRFIARLLSNYSIFSFSVMDQIDFSKVTSQLSFNSLQNLKRLEFEAIPSFKLISIWSIVRRANNLESLTIQSLVLSGSCLLGGEQLLSLKRLKLSIRNPYNSGRENLIADFLTKTPNLEKLAIVGFTGDVFNQQLNFLSAVPKLSSFEVITKFQSQLPGFNDGIKIRELSLYTLGTPRDYNLGNRSPSLLSELSTLYLNGEFCISSAIEFYGIGGNLKELYISKRYYPLSGLSVDDILNILTPCTGLRTLKIEGCIATSERLRRLAGTCSLLERIFVQSVSGSIDSLSLLRHLKYIHVEELPDQNSVDWLIMNGYKISTIPEENLEIIRQHEQFFEYDINRVEEL